MRTQESIGNENPFWGKVEYFRIKSFHLLHFVSEYKIFPIFIAVLIYSLSLLFTAPTRHGADRFYLLATDIIKHHSINIQKLVEDKNHYAMVSVDVFSYNNIRYIGVHPGQAFWGTPGLSVYYFIKHFNSFSQNISVSQDANDKYDFILGSFAINSTSSALFTAITSLFFIYLVAASFSHLNIKRSSICVFMLLFYLATPLFYYSTHIVENQTESCLVFISLALLCLNITIERNRLKNLNYSLAGFIIGLAFLTNFSSIILLPFGFMHIALNGLTSLDLRSYTGLYQSIRNELIAEPKKKIVRSVWLFIGWLLPTIGLLYYQYLLFSNPFKSVYTFLAELPPKSTPTLFGYIQAFLSSLVQYMFSTKVGLFSYTPILLFPIVIFLLGLRTRKQRGKLLETNNQPSQFNRSFFRTMLIVQPLYIFFYTLFAAVHFVNNEELISNYNLYSARHLLPIIFPMGYVLFDSLLKINESKSIKWIAWSVLIVLWIFSLANNISATFIGDWIFSLNQIWDYIYRLRISGWDFLHLKRALIDW